MFTDYYGAMDRYYGRIEPSDTAKSPSHPVEVSNLTVENLGTSTNPMQHQVAAFGAKIREGASKVEISFLGAGKSNSQQPSPEAFGKRDREDIRALAEINKVSTSVHAALHGESLAGLGREGFSGEARQHALKEIERAIQFAAEATKGGAIVFHTGEWMRPMTEMQDKTGAKFVGYDDESLRAPKIIVADDRTGEITAVRKDHRVYEPKFYTAKEYEKVIGQKIVGTRDSNGNVIEAEDWIDLKHNAIKKSWLVSNDSEKIERLFDRIPVFNEDKTNFQVELVEFKDFERLARQIEEKTGERIAPEVLFFKTQLANQVSQSKGQSLFYAHRYKQLSESRDATKKALEFYNSLEKEIPENEKWKILQQKRLVPSDLGTPQQVLPSQLLNEHLKDTEDQMRHIHESSAFADTQAKQTLERMSHIKPVEEYGLQKTADTIARAGLTAREYYLAHKKELNEPIYAAPENYRPELYGSHPDEIRKIVSESRKAMADRLVQTQHLSKKDAEAEAERHIKATIDIGHFNLWRQFFQGNDNETPDQRHARFNKWALEETEKLAKEGLVGHIHITDNFGFDDEHVTPGQGNAPIKEFLKRMEKHGVKSMIAEAGSYNGSTILQDTWAMVGSPVYGAGRVPMTFRGVHEQHFGYHNPSTYIVGAYAPSNEWHLWTEVPFE